MKLDTFFDNFELLADAPNGVQKLREMILQLAVQGKLVPQDSKDEPASVLLEKIKAEKERLVKEKKIKKTKVIPIIKPDALKYKISLNWEIERLGNIAFLITKGSTPTTYGFQFQNEGINFVKVENVKGGHIVHNSIMQFISEEAHNAQARSQLEEGDVLFSIAGTIGETCIVQKKDVPANTNQALAIIRGTKIAFKPEFLKLLLDSFVANAIKSRARGGAMNNVSLGDIKELIVLIPPLLEQKRIVAKVDELMALCDELEARKQQVSINCIQLNDVSVHKLLTAEEPKKFSKHWQRICNNFDLLYSKPENVIKLRQAILQLAVQGKLVPQDPKDEPASILAEKIKAEKERLIKEKKIKKPKPLPPIEADEIPYELPANWEWVKLGEFFDVRDGTHDTPKYVSKGLPLITSKNISNGMLDFSNIKYISAEDHKKIKQRSVVDRLDILFAMIGSIGNPVIVDTNEEFSIKNVALFKYYSIDLSCPDYLLLFLKNASEEMKQKSSGAVQSFVSLKFLRNYLFPMPPLREQRRIANKVDQLMTFCDELETSLSQSQTDCDRLMEASVAEIMAV